MEITPLHGCRTLADNPGVFSCCSIRGELQTANKDTYQKSNRSEERTEEEVHGGRSLITLHSVTKNNGRVVS